MKTWIKVQCNKHLIKVTKIPVLSTETKVREASAGVLSFYCWGCGPLRSSPSFQWKPVFHITCWPISAFPEPAAPKRRFKHGTNALMEIRKYQRTANLLLPKGPFSRLVIRPADQLGLFSFAGGGILPRSSGRFKHLIPHRGPGARGMPAVFRTQPEVAGQRFPGHLGGKPCWVAQRDSRPRKSSDTNSRSHTCRIKKVTLLVILNGSNCWDIVFFFFTCLPRLQRSSLWCYLQTLTSTRSMLGVSPCYPWPTVSQELQGLKVFNSATVKATSSCLFF